MKRRRGRWISGLFVWALLMAGLAVLGPAAPVGAVEPPIGTVTDFAKGMSNTLGVAAGPDGNVWFTNGYNNSIGRITSGGSITIFTGPGISLPWGITAGSDGALWFTNSNDSIGRITTAGVVSTFTGAGIANPNSIASGPDGALWFTNQGNHSIGRISTAGIVSNFASNTTGVLGGITNGPDGALWFTSQTNGVIGRITTAGVVTTFSYTGSSGPDGIVTGSDGNLWFTNTHSIGRITPAGTVTLFPGSGSTATRITSGPDGALWYTNTSGQSIGRITTAGAFTSFGISATDVVSPMGIAAGPDGSLWFGTQQSNAIGRMSTAGSAHLFRGSGVSGPQGIVATSSGHLYFTNSDAANSSIGTITPAGLHGTFRAPTTVSPTGITLGPDGALWFTNSAVNAPASASIGRMTTAGVTTSFTAPSISRPTAIASGSDGALWFTNAGNNSIGRISTTGTVTNFTAASISNPGPIARGPDGALWFTNQGSNSIGRITVAGAVTNFADSTISGPAGIAAGPDGALWFTNTLNSSIGRITTTGSVTNFTGSAINRPLAITAGPDGALWFTNDRFGGNSIGRITTAGSSTAFTDPSISDPSAIVTGPDLSMWFTNRGGNSIGRITAITTPGAPTSVVAVAGDHTATVSWVAPAITGGLPPSGYHVQSSPSGGACGWSGGPLSCEVAGLVNGTSYTFTVTAGNSLGDGPPSQPSNAVTPETAKVVALTPGRVLETRSGAGLGTVDGLFQGGGVRPGGSTLALTVAGRAGVPAMPAAVSLNVTVTGPAGAGYVTVFPCGVAQPNASTVNFVAGQVIANAVLTKVGSGGQVCLFTNMATDLVVDVNGFFPAGSTFASVSPGRVLETRSGAGLATVDGLFQGGGVRPGGSTLALTVTGRAGVPAMPAAVSLNVTVTGSAGPGFVTVFPCGEALPNASNVNFLKDQVIANAVIVHVGTNGQVCLFTSMATDLVVDVNGFFPSGFGSLSPARVLETRSGPGLGTVDGLFQGGGVRPGGSTLALTVAGRAGVPAGADAVVLTVTVTGPTGAGFVTVFPCGVPRPNASSVNFVTGQVIANAVITKIGANGQVCLFTTMATDLVVDVNGAFLVDD